MNQNQQISPLKRAIIVGNLQDGATQRQVAIRYGVSQSAVSKIALKFRRTGDVKNLPKSGRRRVTTAREDVHVTTTASRNRRLSGKNLFQFVLQDESIERME